MVQSIRRTGGSNPHTAVGAWDFDVLDSRLDSGLRQNAATTSDSWECHFGPHGVMPTDGRQGKADRNDLPLSAKKRTRSCHRYDCRASRLTPEHLDAGPTHPSGDSSACDCSTPSAPPTNCSSTPKQDRDNSTLEARGARQGTGTGRNDCARTPMQRGTLNNEPRSVWMMRFPTPTTLWPTLSWPLRGAGRGSPHIARHEYENTNTHMESISRLRSSRLRSSTAERQCRPATCRQTITKQRSLALASSHSAILLKKPSHTSVQHLRPRRVRTHS